MSDNTQNLQDLRWDLQTIDLSNVTSAGEHDQTHEDNYESGEAKTIQKKKKNKKKRRRKKRRMRREITANIDVTRPSHNVEETTPVRPQVTHPRQLLTRHQITHLPQTMTVS
jgi:hypothetical protein